MIRFSDIEYSMRFNMQKCCSKFRSCRLKHATSILRPAVQQIVILIAYCIENLYYLCFWSRISSPTVITELLSLADYSMAPNTISFDVRTCMLALWRFAHVQNNVIVCCMRRSPVRREIRTDPDLLTLTGPNGGCGCSGVKISGRGWRVSPLLSLFLCPHGDAEGVPGWPRGRAGHPAGIYTHP